MCKTVLIISLLFGVNFIIPKINCEIFSAIEELEKLFHRERLFIKEIEIFSEKFDNDYVNRKLKGWKNEYNISEAADIWKYITNPLNAFLMIKRSTTDVKLLERHFVNQSVEIFQNIRNSDSDLSGAVGGLLRLQFYYKLKTKDFANGIIDGEQTRSPLSVHDLFIIGEEALKIDKQDYFAMEYLRLAWEQLNDGLDVDNEVDEKVLILYLLNTYHRVGYNGKALEMLKELKIKFPEIAALYSLLEETLLDKLKSCDASNHNNHDPFSNDFEKDGIFSDAKDRILNSQICRGDISKTSSKLYCRYVSTNPFSTLARFKIEEANINPYMVLFIDVVSDDEINFLKEASKLKQGPGTITTSNSLSSHRVAQISWHNENEHHIFRRLSQRIEDMTGLSQKTAEPLQTQNYGIGGHYFGHWDCFMKWDKPFKQNGNRIATVLFYLSDVEKGGGTVFPFLKLRILPRKGAAIFWHNLSSSGECDYLTRHSACPVLLGSKWVANAWIREHENEFRRPCALDDIYDNKKMEQFLFKTFY